MSGLHQSITLSFMLVGHTKFSPDWCFWLLKQRFRRTFVSSLQDLVDVVNASANVNVAQLVGTLDGVIIYNWATFLGEKFCKVPQMRSFHHFHFSVSNPGVVTMKQYSKQHMLPNTNRQKLGTISRYTSLSHFTVGIIECKAVVPLQPDPRILPRRYS